MTPVCLGDLGSRSCIPASTAVFERLGSTLEPAKGTGAPQDVMVAEIDRAPTALSTRSCRGRLALKVWDELERRVAPWRWGCGPASWLCPFLLVSPPEHYGASLVLSFAICEVGTVKALSHRSGGEHQTHVRPCDMPGLCWLLLSRPCLWGQGGGTRLPREEGEVKGGGQSWRENMDPTWTRSLGVHPRQRETRAKPGRANAPRDGGCAGPASSG